MTAPHGISAVEGIRVGHAQVPGGGSGCTVVLGPFRARVETPGMASGTRELAVLDEIHVSGRADALLLTGGSAFGLGAAQGVMEWIAARGEGFPTPGGPVPIVPAAVLYDLSPGHPRPGPAEGEAACRAAGAGPVPRGRVGAGSGARVGKLLGPEASTPGGVGSASGRWGRWTVAALAVVNSLGEVVDRAGRRVAGPDGTGALLAGELAGSFGRIARGESTTLAVVATDAPLSSRELAQTLKVAATGLARRITPVHTPFDGDVVFGVVPDREPVSLSPVEVLALGVALREKLEDAILDAVRPVPEAA